MERLDRLADCFKEKERKRLNDLAKVQENAGLPEMTLDEIKLSCLENNGYETPELNDKLYLHFRGFKKIENLDRYTGCKALWLDSNGLEIIENLDKLTELRCLYLSKNLISKITGLECLSKLVSLDLSNNRISLIEKLEYCPCLQTINLSRNVLGSVESIENLAKCPELVNIDITNNRLPPEDEILTMLQTFPKLVNISVNGNELTKLPSFRKRCIAAMPKLGYLDRPIEELERIGAEAFVSGGIDAETAAREAYRNSKQEQKRKETADFRAWQKQQAELRAQQRAEGRSFILQMSEEEIAARRKEAEDDAKYEKLMLSQGISKLAAKYWELDAKNGNTAGYDALEAAGRHIVDEASSSNTSDRVVEIIPDDDVAPESEKVSDSSHVTDMAAVVSDVETLSIDPDSASEMSCGVSPEKDIVIEASDSIIISDVAVEMLEETPQEIQSKMSAAEAAKEEDQRQQRIAESFAIFKRQLQDTKNGIKPTQTSYTKTLWDSNSSAQIPNQPIWDASAYLPKQPTEKNLYWSESMDIELANNVRKHVFNFDQVATAMVALASSGALGLLILQSPELLTSEACRLRWAQLDAEKWSEMPPQTTALDTVFKICVQPNILGAGHGAQPTFQAMSALAAGSLPSYLVPPVSLPSVVDADSDVDDTEPIVA